MKNQAAIVIAVVLGLLAAVGVWSQMKRIEKQSAGSSGTVMVVKASRDIEEGERLTPDNVESDQASAKALQGGKAIPWSEKEIYLNSYRLQRKVGRGTWLTKEMLLRSSRRSMASELAASERAITIAVDQISGVAGYIVPGDHVDIYATFTVPTPTKTSERRADIRTYPLLTNVRVLQTGARTGLSRRRAFASKSTAYTSVTLRVREQDAHILAFAQAQGQLTLALRPPGDPTQPARGDLDMRDLIKLLEARTGGGR